MVSVCIGDYDLVVTGKALRSFNYQLLKAEIMHVFTHTHTRARTHTHTHSVASRHTVNKGFVFTYAQRVRER